MNEKVKQALVELRKGFGNKNKVDLITDYIKALEKENFKLTTQNNNLREKQEKQYRSIR